MLTDENRITFWSPPSDHYLKNRLFDENNPVLNRDGGLKVFVRAKKTLESLGHTVQTSDYLFDHPTQNSPVDFYSFGSRSHIARLDELQNVRRKGFILFEPPVVDPSLYLALPEITKRFENVYLHNTDGDGYSLDNVDRSKLRKLYWPQPFEDVLEPLWNKTDRLHRIVVINGNHRPLSRNNELYSERMNAMRALAKFDAVDLFGRGWNRWWSGNSRWMPYWKNILALKKIYKGACDSKYEVLSRYRFCLCFENMKMKGYITEKIFDCLYAGAIPVYLGASDIENLIPPNVYIDGRKYQSWGKLWPDLQKLSAEQLDEMKNAGREFIRSPEGQKYVHFIENEICR